MLGDRFLDSLRNRNRKDLIGAIEYITINEGIELMQWVYGHVTVEILPQLDK
jgi:hypothetical protein